MGFDLLGNQMALRNLHLLIFSIAFQPDNLHPVEKWLRQIETVRGAHEHDVRKIEIEFKVVILEFRVLFGIEHFEQRRGRIAAEILTQFVDFIEQEKRIARPGLLEVGNDLARHRANVSAPVAADFRLVTHPAQRLAHEFTARCPRDRFAQRRLAHSRRADKAQDRPLQLVGARLHCEVFDDAILDLFQRIVIGIKHVLRLGDVFLQLGFLAPWQTKQHVEIVADNGRLGAHRLHRTQLFQLGMGLGLGFLG